MCNVNEYKKHKLEVDAANAKALFKRDMALDLECRKLCIREAYEENKKTLYDEVIIRENGEFEIITRNLSFDAKPRKLCNFAKPEMIKLFNEKDVVEVLMVKIEIGEKKFELYLAANRIGDSKYLAKKFSEVGCEIYANNRRLREEYLHKMVVCMMNRIDRACYVPDKRGWNRNSDGTFKFVGPDSPIWKEVLKWSK